MEHALHPAAIHHLPFFITAPGHTDYLFFVIAVIVVVVIVLLGSIYLTVHSLPERMAHRNNKGQMQLVAVLALIGLFTHNNILWLGALLIAMVRLPDFRTPHVSIADSLDRIARRLERRPPPDEPLDQPSEEQDLDKALVEAAAEEVRPAPPPKAIAARERETEPSA